MLLKGVRQTGFPDGGEQIAMTRRTPFQVGVGGTYGRAGGKIDLRLHMLDDLSGNARSDGTSIRVDDLHGVFRRAERVHQGHRQLHTEPLASGDDLAGDNVDEAHLTSLMAASTGSSDFAQSRPMEVPRPPLSLKRCQRALTTSSWSMVS